MKTLIRSMLALLVISSWTITNSAYADDIKVHAGVSCQPYFGSDAPYLNAYIGGLYNSDTKGHWVSCGIVRDNTTNYNGTKAVLVNLNRSTSASSASSCYLWSHDIWGTLVDSHYNTYSNTGSNLLYLNVDSSGYNGYYSLMCVTVHPPRSFA